MVEAEQEVDGLYRAAITQAELEANSTKEAARREMDDERNQARSQLQSRVDQLSDQIINRLLTA